MKNIVANLPGLRDLAGLFHQENTVSEQSQSHPGWRFFSILTQYHDYLQLYKQFGFEGVPHRLLSTTHQALHSQSLESIQASLTNCKRCKLHAGRTHIVFGAGNPHADLMFVGEAPGDREDKQGEPFVGKAGELLTRILQAIGLQRDDVYITNLIKCRPPHNRDPEPDEVACCESFLRQQIEYIQPQIICALGPIAAQTLLKTTHSIAVMRGQFHDYNGVKLMPTYHPAYLLRYPEKKRLVWQDVQLIQREYQRIHRALNTHSQET